MTQHPISAIGAVIINDQLTVVIRRGDLIEEPLQFPIRTPLEAAVILLKQRDIPVPIFIASGGFAAQVLEEIQKQYAKSPDKIVNGMSPALSMADRDVEFANRRSELFFRLFEKIENGKLVLPATFNEQLAAFVQQEQGGKIFFPSPDDVADRLGKHPAYALAAVLAAIQPARTGPVRTKSPPGVGHDPYAKRLT